MPVRFQFIADAANLEFIDSYGIGVLLKSAVYLQQWNGEIRVRNLQGPPLEIISKAGLVNLINLDTSPQESESNDDLLQLVPESHELEIAQERIEDVLVFRFSGFMKVPNAVKLFRREAVSAMAEANKILIDMTRLEYLDSNAILEIIRLHLLLKTSGGSIAICCPNELMKDTLNTVAIDRLISIHDSVASAIKEWPRDSDERGSVSKGMSSEQG